jgi:hypothetical protein
LELSQAKPTATQVEGEVHDTPVNVLFKVFAARASKLVHSVPFHSIANGLISDVLIAEPTAMQTDGETHDTLAKALSANVGTRSLVTDHTVPFHRTVSAVLLCSPIVFPTAIHAVGVLHDTPNRGLIPVRSNDVGAWTVHAVPSHRCINALSSELPTAMQIDSWHDTLWREPSALGAALWMAQILPFHFSVKVSNSHESVK